MKILVNSRRGKFSSEFCGMWGIRVECTVNICIYIYLAINVGISGVLGLRIMKEFFIQDHMTTSGGLIKNPIC